MELPMPILTDTISMVTDTDIIMDMEKDILKKTKFPDIILLQLH